MGRKVSDILAEQLQTKVNIGNVRWGLLNRIVISEVKLYDQQDTLMLDVSRVAAKIDLFSLAQKKINIRNAQLIGANANLYQNDAKQAPNFKFIIEALKSNDNEPKKGINLRIGTLIVKKGQIKFEKSYLPKTEDKFNVNHLNFKNINITAELKHLTPDSLNLQVRRFSFEEKSGIELKRLQFRVIANRNVLSLSDLTMTLPHSTINLPLFSAVFQEYPWQAPIKEWIKTLNYESSLKADICPADMAALLPDLQQFRDNISIETEIEGNKEKLQISKFEIQNESKNIRIKTNVTVKDVTNFTSSALLQINQLQLQAGWQDFIKKNFKGIPAKALPFMTRIGKIKAEGSFAVQGKTLKTQLATLTDLGKVEIHGQIINKSDFSANIKTKSFHIGTLLDISKSHQLQDITLESHITGKLPNKKDKLAIQSNGTILDVTYRDHTYRNTHFKADYTNNTIHTSIKHDEEDGLINLSTSADLNSNIKHFLCQAEIKNFCPNTMNLVKTLEGEHFSGNIDADISFENINKINGYVNLTNLSLFSETEGLYNAGDICLTTQTDETGQHIDLQSPQLQVKMNGAFKWQDLKNTFLHLTHSHLPNIIPAPKHVPETPSEISFDIQIEDTTLIHRLLDKPISIPQKGLVQGEMDGSLKTMFINAQLPSLIIGNEKLRTLECRIESTKENLQTSFRTDRIMKDKSLELKFNTHTTQNRLMTNLSWDNHQQQKRQHGNIDITGAFHSSLYGSQALTAMINPSYIIINDTTWTIPPAHVNLHHGVVDVENVRMIQGERHLVIDGRISPESTDTLTADLHNLNLSYIFDIINFHAVEFDGDATGKVYAHGVMKNPQANAYLQVSNFTFNEGYLGDMDIHVSWGQKFYDPISNSLTNTPATENAETRNCISLDADIQDLASNHKTTVLGTIAPGKKPGCGLNLNVNARRINLHFINKYTEGIFSNVKGKATGQCRIYGPFKQIDMNGDLIADEASMLVDMLGVNYSLSGDSIMLRPGNFIFPRATIYDANGEPNSTTHTAQVSGRLMHQHFKNMSYDFQIRTNNLLCYDFKDFGDLSFYGTIYADGQVHIMGAPGTLTIDVEATPQAGSSLVYNVTSPETITETGFITYVDRSLSAKDTLTTQAPDSKQEEESDSDVRLNMHLDVNENTTLQLLMDTKSGDRINLNGNGRITANYYNKGKFQMYGTYRVESGIYKLSLQDIIRKDFVFQPNSSIVFSGDAYQAALNLKAIYSVPNVSLDDLSATGLGFSNTRVDCIMNIGGQAFSPQITFDFDLPNANEDEKQMVRSMISTEEERNMQVIYLLGIGRFYSFDTQYANNNSNQSEVAVNSLISSTLSGQFNEILSNAMGTSNWSFGANLRTGETGWDQLDVEGILSGKMLNNRLLINGNIGYRESYYSTNNFIGDFDVQYLLLPNSGLYLKAYNQTNDRYFIQSSLTTQGIGFQFKKDFNNWKEAFQKNSTIRRKNRKEKKK